MSAGALDRLAVRMQSMALHVQENVGSGVERFRVSMVNPFRITELGGELVLEDGDPDFTIGEALRGAITAGDVQTGHLIWVARDEQEWHAFDVVGNATTGTARDATSLRGRAVSSLAPSTGQALLWTGSSWTPASLPSSSPPSGAAGGDLQGTYPNPTLKNKPITWHGLPYNATNWKDANPSAGATLEFGQYGLDALGFGHVRGWVASVAGYAFASSPTLTIATIPAGFRPGHDVGFIAMQRDSVGNRAVLRMGLSPAGLLQVIEDVANSGGNNGNVLYMPLGTISYEQVN